MSNAFLIAAVVLNVGFALVVFWWVFRELRRGKPGKPAPTDRPERR
jgi:heme/copper-type cytochrome/quinol oxidase subunit 2